ncbi:MAG: choline monooxygenase [Bacteroidia bacterium]|jgi:choline monooxygenase
MFQIDPNIAIAATMPRPFYTDSLVFKQLKDVFAGTWQYAGDAEKAESSNVFPIQLLPEFLNDPLLLTRDDEGVTRCISNVCTHRANLLIDEPTKGHEIRCNYHGRRFDLNGKFKSMPGFEGVENFPCENDDLPELSLKKFAGLQFTSLAPKVEFESVFGDMIKRMSFLPLEKLKFDEDRSQEFKVKANWALYCDNYLEGFHIPFVHPGLNAELDFGEYEYELFDHSNLQIGIGKSGDHVFDLPANHPDYGKNIAAYYWWVYPNLMFNFYPWGLSFNIVNPLKPDLTKVSFRAYVMDESKLDSGAGAGLDTVEAEDEAVVEQVQRGVQSRLYNRGRYSATMEKCVHHFHRLVSADLNSS